MTSIRATVVALAASIAALATPAAAQQAPIKVIVFPGLSNLAIFAAQHKGYFAKNNVAIEIVNTPNSSELRDGLAAGRYQIAHAAVDNAVAQIENQKVDARIVMGGDGGLNVLYAQNDIGSIADLKGKTVGVDALNTAYALLLYKVLKSKGLERGKDYTPKAIGGTLHRLKAMQEDKSIAASMLNPPFSIAARKTGTLKSLGSPSEVVGSYQAGGVWVLTSWAKANEDLLVRYLRSNVEGIRWAKDPANKAEAAKMLVDRLKIAQDVAEDSLALGLDEKGGGFVKDLAFNLTGFKTVLALRAELEGQWGGEPPAPDKFLDTSYYAKAMAGLK